MDAIAARRIADTADGGRRMARPEYYTKTLCTPVVYVPCISQDHTGSPVYGDPEQITVKWDRTCQRLRGPNADSSQDIVSICFPIGFEPSKGDCIWNPNGLSGSLVEDYDPDDAECSGDVYRIDQIRECQVRQCNNACAWSYFTSEIEV